MKELSLANRYAAAVYEEAKSAKKVEVVMKDILALQELFNDSQDFNTIIFSSALNTAEKLAVLEKMSIKCGFNRIIQGLLTVLTRNRRLTVLPQVLEVITKLVHDETGEVEVSLSYASKIDDVARKDITAKLVKLTGKKVILKEELDPSLLCGMKIVIGNTMYDVSAKGRIEALRSHLMK